MKFEFKGPRRFAHQRDMLRRLIETKGVCALLADPGTGKTAPTLDYLAMLALKSGRVVDGEREARVLVISPKAAMDNWVLQAEQYVSDQVNLWAEVLGGQVIDRANTLRSRGPERSGIRAYPRKKDPAQDKHRALNHDRSELLYVRGADKVRGPSDLRGKPRLILLSTNYDTFSSRARVKSKTMADVLIDAIERFQPDAIVVDEMHKIKGRGSNMSRLIGRIGDRTRRRIGLTGTVMPMGPEDIYAQWRFILPTAFGPVDYRTGKRGTASWSSFERRYLVMGGYMRQEITGYANLDELQAIMAKNSIVVKKEDAIDLPKMTDTKISITLSSKEANAYEGMKQQLALKIQGDDVTAQNRLTQMLRLRQITSGHLPSDNGNVIEVGTSKIDAVKSLVHDTLGGENRIVVFALFRHEINALADSLKASGTEVMVIDGRTPDSQRLAKRKRFGDTTGSPQRIVLVAQVQTLSLSVNELVTASNAIFATLSQRRDELVQARDRLNRIGQERPCTFWYVLARGTVDEVIYKSHQSRTNLEAAILEHVQGSAPGAENEGAEIL